MEFENVMVQNNDKNVGDFHEICLEVRLNVKATQRFIDTSNVPNSCDDAVHSAHSNDKI